MNFRDNSACDAGLWPILGSEVQNLNTMKYEEVLYIEKHTVKKKDLLSDLWKFQAVRPSAASLRFPPSGLSIVLGPSFCLSRLAACAATPNGAPLRSGLDKQEGP